MCITQHKDKTLSCFAKILPKSHFSRFDPILPYLTQIDPI